MTFLLTIESNMGRFHQHFLCSFYLPRSQKLKNTVKLSVFFALLGSPHIKASSKHVDEIETMLLLIHSAVTSLDLALGGSKLLKINKYFNRGDLRKSLRC